MKVTDTTDIWVDPLRVATAVAFRVLVIDFRNCMERLVKVAYIVDD